MFVNEIFGLKKYDKDERGSSSSAPRNPEDEESDDGIIFAEYISGIAYRLLRIFLAAGIIFISREICFYVYDKTNDEGGALLCAFMFIGVVVYVFLPRLKEKRGGRRYR